MIISSHAHTNPAEKHLLSFSIPIRDGKQLEANKKMDI